MAYFHVYFLLPKLLFQKKIISYIVFFFIALAVFYLVRTELIFLFINENVWPESQTPQRAYAFNHILVVSLIGIYDIALATTLKLTTSWIVDRRRMEDLKSMQLKTELQFLKAQIQPHFFFNTLNNLYALTLEKSAKAPDVVLKLSKIMEYVLYDAKEPKTTLIKEIKYIQNYIDLEKLRHQDNVNVKIEMKGNLDNCVVPPLLFLPFIENCFKHGTKEGNILDVLIKFSVVNNVLTFYAKNSFIASLVDEKQHGIGNKNVLRRLELLFADKYSYQSKIENKNYIIELTIQL